MTTSPLADIPMPQILDPDRMVLPERDDLTIDDHRDRVTAVGNELRRTCEYGQALRQELQAVRGYLSVHFPADEAPRSEWLAWRELYGSVVSSLAGAKGDSGFGLEEATIIAEQHGFVADSR